MKSQARTTLVRQLSQRPWAILASELAESGAMISRSAHLRRSICSTGSPLFCQTCHSSSSPAEECGQLHSGSVIQQFSHKPRVFPEGVTCVLQATASFNQALISPAEESRSLLPCILQISCKLTDIVTEPGLALKQACVHETACLRPLIRWSTRHWLNKHMAAEHAKLDMVTSWQLFESTLTGQPTGQALPHMSCNSKQYNLSLSPRAAGATKQ